MTITSSYEPDDWISRADAAEIAEPPATGRRSAGSGANGKPDRGCSEDTLRRDEQRHGLETRVGPNGATMYRVADLIRIGRIKASSLVAGSTGSETAEVIRARRTISALQREADLATGALEMARTHITTLNEALTAARNQHDKLLAAHNALVLRLPTGGHR